MKRRAIARARHHHMMGAFRHDATDRLRRARRERTAPAVFEACGLLLPFDG
jgi:hypothetical protein